MKQRNLWRIISFFTLLIGMVFVTAYAECCITYEAENAMLSGLCSVVEKNGVSGGKSVGTIDYNPDGAESTVTFTVSVVESRDYIVYVHAAGEVGTFPNPAHDYYVNGDVQNRKTLAYTHSSTFSSPWIYTISVPFHEGINTISFTYSYPGEPWWSTCAELDCIRVRLAGDDVLPIALEAEDCYLTGTACTVTSVGAHDNAKVGYIDNADATVNFKITVPEDGEYLAVLRADGGVGFSNEQVASHAIYVNGDKENKTIVQYPGARFWDFWYDYPVSLSLKAGENVVTVTHSGEDNSFAELDRMVFWVPGEWSTAQPAGIITLEKAYDITDSTYTFEGTIFLDNNDSVSGIALCSDATNTYYMVEAHAGERMFKLYRATRNADGTWNVDMKGYKRYNKIKHAAIAKLRIEVNGTHLRAYYLNEVGGETPWQEFDFDLPDLGAMTYAATFAVSGRNAVLSISFSEEGFTLSTATFQNPVIRYLADPDVIFENGIYYAYGTTDGNSFDVYKSTDLVNWTKKEDILANPVPWSGANVNFWAPGVAKIDGRFYLAGTINESIGFFVADHPEGPFHLIGSGPVFRRSIDANIFVDDDGRVYIYYVSWDNGVYGIYGVEYNRNLTARLSGITHMLSPDSEWEMHSGAITEGPYMLKHNGLYYLTYSGSNYESDHYAIGYATLTSPLGHTQKYEDNPIFRRTSDIAGTAHHGFVRSAKGELFLIYHAHDSVNSIHPRNMCVGRARFVKDVGGKPDYLELGSPIVALQDQLVSECYISFNANNGTGVMPDTQSAVGSVIYQMPTSLFTRPGYVQTGWAMYRPYTNQWLYSDPAGFLGLAWHNYGAQPAGSDFAMVDLDGGSFIPVNGGENLVYFAMWQEGEMYYDSVKENVYVRLPRDVETGRVWYAVYEGDVLIGVESVEIKGTAGQTAHAYLANRASGTQKAFLFTWDNGMLPIHDKKPVTSF